MPDIEDRIWVERIRAGDAEAFEFVFRQLAPGLRAFAVRYVDSPEQAEDLVQDLFLTLWRNRESLELHASLVTYLYSATRNRAFNYLKHERIVRDWRRSRSTAAHRVPQLASPADTDLLHAELARAVQSAIERLPERTRLVFTMSRHQRMTYVEIAQALGLSVKTIETQMGRALLRLRASLGELFA